MKIKNYHKEYAGYLTRRQLLLQGLVPTDKNDGISLWTNSFCNRSAVYFDSAKTRPATADELREFREAQNARRRERRKKIRDERERIRAARQARKDYRDRLAAIPIEQITLADPRIVLDCETTGLDPHEDEILQISILDCTGTVLLTTYLKPRFASKWPGAERVHHITPEMVEDAPSAEDIMPRLGGIIAAATTVIVYNGRFDLAFVANLGIDITHLQLSDVMLDFAPIFGEWSERHEDWKWQPLSTCAAHYGFEYSAHDALEDARATLFCYQQMHKA